jgi:hypothetical protein
VGVRCRHRPRPTHGGEAGRDTPGESQGPTQGPVAAGSRSDQRPWTDHAPGVRQRGLTACEQESVAAGAWSTGEDLDGQAGIVEYTGQVLLAGQAVLAARSKLAPATLAEMYEPTGMNRDLVKAHEALDKAVDAIFKTGKRPWTDDERLRHLLDRYVATRAGEKLALAPSGASSARPRRRKTPGRGRATMADTTRNRSAAEPPVTGT